MDFGFLFHSRTVISRLPMKKAQRWDMVSVWPYHILRTVVVLKYMWCKWYFNYGISLSSLLQLHFIIVYYPQLFMLDYDFKAPREFASSNKWGRELRIDFLLSRENTLPSQPFWARLHSWIYMTTLSEAVIFHLGCFPIRNKERNGNAGFPSVGFEMQMVSVGKELTAAVKAESFTAELWVT